MKLTGQFNYLGVESFTGKGDTPQKFNNLVILQDTEVIKIFLNEQDLPKTSTFNYMDKIDCTLDVKDVLTKNGVKTYKTFVDIKKSVSKVA